MKIGDYIYTKGGAKVRLLEVLPGYTYTFSDENRTVVRPVQVLVRTKHRDELLYEAPSFKYSGISDYMNLNLSMSDIAHLLPGYQKTLF